MAADAASILVLGAGELGAAILSALTSHPALSDTGNKITLAVRPASLTTKAASLAAFNVALLGVDIEASPVETLTSTFAPFTCVVHAGAMAAAPGTQRKVTEAVLAAGVKLYLPWQHGVDYDVIGPDAAGGLFAEQCDVRRLLRAQTATRWVIVSSGIFTSFLFEGFWGVVAHEERWKVRALGDWAHGITTTAAEDIGRACAEVILGDQGEVRDQVVYIAGDTLTYAAFADVVERVLGEQVDREVWSREDLKAGAEREPDNKLLKYRVVFSGEGVSWPVEGTWSHKKGMQMEGVESWLRRNREKVFQ